MGVRPCKKCVSGLSTSVFFSGGHPPVTLGKLQAMSIRQGRKRYGKGSFHILLALPFCHENTRMRSTNVLIAGEEQKPTETCLEMPRMSFTYNGEVDDTRCPFVLGVGCCASIPFSFFFLWVRSKPRQGRAEAEETKCNAVQNGLCFVMRDASNLTSCVV